MPKPEWEISKVELEFGGNCLKALSSNLGFKTVTLNRFFEIGLGTCSKFMAQTEYKTTSVTKTGPDNIGACCIDEPVCVD